MRAGRDCIQIPVVFFLFVLLTFSTSSRWAQVLHFLQWHKSKPSTLHDLVGGIFPLHRCKISMNHFWALLLCHKSLGTKFNQSFNLSQVYIYSLSIIYLSSVYSTSIYLLSILYLSISMCYQGKCEYRVRRRASRRLLHSAHRGPESLCVDAFMCPAKRASWVCVTC